MTFGLVNTLAILAMAAATYLCRAGGYWLFSQIRPSPFLRSALAYVPGTLFVSFVLPSLIAGGGVHPWVGTVVTLVVVFTMRSLAAAILAGTAAAYATWALLQ